MGSKSPKLPEPVQPQPTPTEEDVEEARLEALRAEQARAGRAATILSSRSDALSADQIRKPTLLGATA